MNYQSFCNSKSNFAVEIRFNKIDHAILQLRIIFSQLFLNTFQSELKISMAFFPRRCFMQLLSDAKATGCLKKTVRRLIKY